MDPWNLAGPLIGAFTQYGINQSNQAENDRINRRNLEHQTMWNQIARDDYEKYYNLTAEREDTAVQRRAADLRAAGINPLIAAGGGGASASQASLPQPQAPREVAFRGDAPRGLDMAVLQAMSMDKDFAIKDQQIENMKAEEALTYARRDEVSSHREYLESGVFKNLYDSIVLRPQEIQNVKDNISLSRDRLNFDGVVHEFNKSARIADQLQRVAESNVTASSVESQNALRDIQSELDAIKADKERLLIEIQSKEFVDYPKWMRIAADGYEKVLDTIETLQGGPRSVINMIKSAVGK